MTKAYAFTAQITRLKRLKNSTNGNPRYTVGFDNASTLTTSSDQSFVTNIESLKGPVQVFISRAGKIVDLQPATEPLLPLSGLGAFERLAEYYRDNSNLLYDGLVYLAEGVHNIDTEAAKVYVKNYLEHIRSVEEK